jgi:AraC family transcriptional regulator
MNPRIELLQQKKLAGIFLTMSLLNDRTIELWRSFLPLRKQISDIIGNELYSIGIYDCHYFENFNPGREFIKGAAVEVTDDITPAAGMNTLVIPSGLYAVFFYKGKPSEGSGFFHYIFSTWLPQSDFVMDDRPHFEILGTNYKNDDPDSEEEIWIPIKHKE